MRVPVSANRGLGSAMRCGVAATRKCVGRFSVDRDQLSLSGSAGFTLVEILVAIFIFVIVVSTIYATYSSTFRLVGTTRNQVEIYQMARVAMERISEDLAAAVVPLQQGEEVAVVDAHALIGFDVDTGGRAADSLRFRSRAQLSFAGVASMAGGQVVISYAVQAAEDGGGLVLYRLETPSGQDGVAGAGDPGFILCDHLAAVNFTYFDQAGVMYDSWDSTGEQFQGRLPARVAVELDFWEAGVDSRLVRFRTAVVLPNTGDRESE